MLDLLKRAPDPDAAVKVTREQIIAALQRAGRRKIDERAEGIHAALNSEHLRVPMALQRAYAVTVKSSVAVVAEVTAIENETVKRLRKHADAEIYLSQPGMGETLSASALGEFGDDRTRCASPKARKNYAGTSPVTIASGRKTCAPHQAHGPTTTANAPAACHTTPPCATSPTVSSASSTAASPAARPTTRPPRGRTTSLRRDPLIPGMSRARKP
ncbi:transposase [Lentzea kentuckyensis]|uniref:transposase n=1 Tax=Lentzea kentuckyensis TaxID=360086 RepID=UPI000A38FD3E|nr:transposase [Lentzea kentuckyensis]